MLVKANLGEYKVIASPIHGQLVKYTEEIFDYLILCLKYQHMNLQRQVT